MHGVVKMDTKGNFKERKQEIWMEEGLGWVGGGGEVNEGKKDDDFGLGMI